MSDSRLEKFIYAICSMEVTDLPVPISRIEKLWNCLITGETPDFEPLSRNEKYLMAMLDRYDISNLPAPMSRGEKLLYKIAVGETDLSDVPGYLSRYEELLKYLIENGGISGSDFEYVLYTLNQSLSTLYNTAEKPVKSAILKGNTLVNLSLFKDTALNIGGVREKKCYNKDIIKPKTNYLISYNVVAVSGETVMKIDGMNVYSFPTELGKHKMIVRTNSNLTTTFPNNLWITDNSNSIEIDDFLIIEYQDGMENWDIPYFEGMQSVKMPVLTTIGNNLLNPNILEIGYLVDGVPSSSGYQEYFRSSQMINVSLLVGKKLYFKSKYDGEERLGNRIFFYDSNEKYLSTSIDSGVVPDNAKFVKVYSKATENPVNFEKVECCLSTINTYEPYKSNILTVNEEVELRGIDDVQDELNLVTSELTERVGDITLDGSADEGWSLLRKDTMTNVFQIAVSLNIKPRSDLLSNLFDGKYVETIKDGVEVIKFNNSKIYVNISNTKATTVEDFKNYIAQQPLTIQYQFTTESVKTVDLSTVDQDGQPTKLKTFNDISHVEIKADNLIPSVDLEVATKISETLSTLGLDHHDISDTQDELGQTIDEQSENTDATMMATTEIYEQIL